MELLYSSQAIRTEIGRSIKRGGEALKEAANVLNVSDEVWKDQDDEWTEGVKKLASMKLLEAIEALTEAYLEMATPKRLKALGEHLCSVADAEELRRLEGKMKAKATRGET